MATTDLPGACDPRPYLQHQALAIAWARYNSASGKATEHQVARIMAHCTAQELERMLAERGVTVQA